MWHYREMAFSSQVYQTKRGRDEYWNGGLALPKAKRTSSRTLAHDSDIIALLDMVNNMDNTDCNTEETEVGMTNSLEHEIGLKAERDHNTEFVDENGNAD